MIHTYPYNKLFRAEQREPDHEQEEQDQDQEEQEDCCF